MKKIKIRVEFDIPMSKQDEAELFGDKNITTDFELEHFWKNYIVETLKEDYIVHKVFVKVIKE